MFFPAAVAQVALFLLLISFAQTPQGATPDSKVSRIKLTQEHLCCLISAVTPVYPREARLARTEGVVTVLLVVAPNGEVADLRPISGDRLLVESVTCAVRKWRFQPTLLNGTPVEFEVSLSFTFKIQDPPKPVYLHLTDGKLIRAEEVREFTNEIEYTVGHSTHHIARESVEAINGCARATVIPKKEGDCTPAGPPSFAVSAIPLLPASRPAPASH